MPPHSFAALQPILSRHSAFIKAALARSGSAIAPPLARSGSAIAPELARSGSAIAPALARSGSAAAAALARLRSAMAQAAALARLRSAMAQAAVLARLRSAMLPSAVVLAMLIAAACAAAPRAGSPTSAPSLSTVPTDTLRPQLVHGVDFDDARAIAADPLGFLYVADAGRHVVVKLTATGAIESVLGGPGSREGEFDEPSGVEPTNGLVLFVADAGNRRIQKFSRSFAHLGSIPLTSADDRTSSSQVTYRQDDGDDDQVATGRPSAIASSDAKDLFAIDADRNVILKWDENLRRAATIGDIEAGRGALSEPVDMATGSESRLYVADRGRRALIVFDAYGSFIRTIGEGLLDRLRAVAVSEEHIVVAHDYDLTIYSSDGARLRSLHLALDAPVIDIAISPQGTLIIVTRRQLFNVLTF